MKISCAKAIFFLIFWPKKLAQITEEDIHRMNTPEAIDERKKKDKETPHHVRSIKHIRKALFWSFILVLISILAALVSGKIYYICGGVKNPYVEELLQYSGIGVLLWATLAKAGWNIQTMGGNTVPELVNEWVFRLLYVIGSFLLALSVTLTFNG